MKNLNKMNVANREYSLESGFFWVEFENGESLQCCLEVIDDTGSYKAEIKEDDNGFDEGLSRDCNRWASQCGWDHINDFLLEQARQAGLEIV